MKRYKDQKIEELRELCKERGLDVEGKKNDLVSRLLRADTAKVELFKQSSATGDKNIKEIQTLITSLAADNYYLLLKSSNLANYFTFGYFYPLALEESEIYKNENRNRDILSIFEEFIVISKSLVGIFESSDVLVELVLSEIPITKVENSELYYIAEPVPISRVKNIFFKTTADKAIFFSSVKTFPDCFIPISICKVISLSDYKLDAVDFDKIKLPQNETLNIWRYRLDLFDKILGLFAFIKNANIFYAERENKLENYSPGFLGTLNLINPVNDRSIYRDNVYLKPLLFYNNIEINSAQRVIFKLIIERIYQNKSFDFKIAIEILEISLSTEHAKSGEQTDIKELIELFKQVEKLYISHKEFLQKEIVRKNQNLPVLALFFLAKFPNKSRQHTDKQAVRNAFIQNDFGIPLNIAEYILGILGLYYGYKNMIKEDTNIRLSDNVFSQIAGNYQSIKFKLESYFERFIIESAFRFAVQQKVLSDTFEFLNWADLSDNLAHLSLNSNFNYSYFDDSFNLMGQKIINISRQDKSEKVFEKLSAQYSEVIGNNTYLAAFFAKYIDIEKRHIIDLLKKNKSQYPINELEDVIDLDRKTKKR